MSRQLVAVGLVVGSAACGGALSQAGAGVKVMTGDPPPSCTEVGSVSSYSVGPNFQEHLKNNMRNDAAAKGGNYLRIEQLASNGNASGTAFHCPDQPAAPVAPAAAAPAQP
jgi:hypothetical protein